MVKKKLLLVVGTRPNFIKITQLHHQIERQGADIELVLIHTGQHFDANMSSIFFEELAIPTPNYHFQLDTKHPAQRMGELIQRLSQIFIDEAADMVMVPGDVDSTLAAAIAANKCGIPVAHLESGLRSKDRGMPEEHNRVLTDHIADYCFVTEQSGMLHLKAEGKDEQGVFFVGNTMIDTLVALEPLIDAVDAFSEAPWAKKAYILATLHRPSNVDQKDALRMLVHTFLAAAEKHHIVWPLHPRTANSLKAEGLWEQLDRHDNIHLLAPQGYLQFQYLLKQAQLVMTDSGGIQEETTYRQIPCLTLRPNTERPVTITLGTNRLVELNQAAIIQALNESIEAKKLGQVPPLWDGQASARIVAILKNILHGHEND